MSSIKQNSDLASHPLAALPREDLDLIVELVLRSGSLKDLAVAYGVSYPTIRVRLDRLIARLKAIVDGQKIDPLAELLARLVERGELSPSGGRAIRDLVRSGDRGTTEPTASDQITSRATVTDSKQEGN